VTEAGARWATLTSAGIDAYIAHVAENGGGLAERTRLSPIEAAQERLLMGLRTFEGVARADLAPLDIDPDAIDELASAGLIAATPQRLVATPAGRAVLDRLTLDLAAAARAD
jgi:oxygen-independent coproporphyrinogen-3 oxidase